MAITRSDGDELFCTTEKSIWTFNPATSQLKKACDAPKGGRFWRIAYDPKSRTLFVTGNGKGGPLFMLKNGRELVSVFVRRHDRISSPTFSSDGEFFYSETGDLWSGKIENEEGRFWLTAERYAPLAWLETSDGTPAEMGVSDIAIARDAIYVQLFRMGGSGWGMMVQVPRLPRKAEEPVSESGPADAGVTKLDEYKQILEGCKPLEENNHPVCLCASRDESRIFYTNEGKNYLITNGATQELHLKKTNASANVGASGPVGVATSARR